MKKKQLAQNTLFVGSGKGGVGKSTISINLSVALSQKGFNVGIFDADLYGPSIPIMLGLRSLSPQISKTLDGKEVVIPFTKFGIKALSLGFFVEESRSIVWRGPVLHNTLGKMINDTEWGELDYLIVDLPPGTGDIPLSLSQLIQIDGAIVICTPQEVAMLDAIKSINAFHQLEIPLYGIIENMSGFTVPDTEITYNLFGEGKGKELAYRFNTPLLGSVPLLPILCLGSDEGRPAAALNVGDGVSEHFSNLASAIIEQCNNKSIIG
ncbi:MAG: Mrp/NBP35 family ATP-binding protein [Chlamydiota bacterium]|nr:Mrp/NBP35 family ATP-binding protein [Chlamydiota bacterium]